MADFSKKWCVFTAAGIWFYENVGTAPCIALLQGIDSALNATPLRNAGCWQAETRAEMEKRLHTEQLAKFTEAAGLACDSVRAGNASVDW